MINAIVGGVLGVRRACHGLVHPWRAQPDRIMAAQCGDGTSAEALPDPTARQGCRRILTPLGHRQNETRLQAGVVHFL